MTSGSFDRPDLAHMRIKSFLTEKLQFEPHVFSQGKFPTVNWKRLGMVDNELGPLILEMAFYDAHVNPVKRADRSGRYGAMVSATWSDGYPIRRFVALYCTAEPWWRDRIELTTRPFDRLSIPDDRWRGHQRTIDKFFGALALRRVGHDESCAALLAGLSEIGQEPNRPPYQNDPLYLDRQWWVTFKWKSTASRANTHPCADHRNGQARPPLCSERAIHRQSDSKQNKSTPSDRFVGSG